MLADGEIVGDGSWNLTIYVTDMDVERTLPVRGDMHMGAVMLRLVENLGISKDWSDHALWWPMKNKWLARARSTLDQYGVHADAVLHFTPMHKPVRIQLPDLRYLDCRLDFSIKTFNAVINLCKTLGIRHPEEMSLCKPLEPCHLKQNYQSIKESKSMRNGHPPPDTNTFISARGSSHSLDKSSPFLCAPATPPPPRSSSATPVAGHHQNGTIRRNGAYSDGSSDGGYCGTPPRAVSLDALDSLNELSLADSPTHQQPLEPQLRPKSLVERARMNVGWLDSSLSIMEQGVREWDTLRLRFKFYAFYDLTPQPYNAPRLNQLYQQARWQLLNQEVHCTEEEMLVFAALQFQIELQALSGGGSQESTRCDSPTPEDEIDAALTELQAQLDGTPNEREDITHVPELADYLKYHRPKKYFPTLAYKRGWVVCRDGAVKVYSSRDAAGRGDSPNVCFQLRGAEVTPDAHPTQNKYCVKLELPSHDAMHEMWLRCEHEEQYARWLAAARLGARGRSLADASYATEVASVRELLALQRPAPLPVDTPVSAHHYIQAESYIAPRFYAKLKNKLTQRVLQNHVNVKDLSLLEAKLRYIKAWQSLPDYGRTLFVVKFMNHKKEELIDIASNRIMRINPSSGDHIKTWHYNEMKAWNVNWDLKHMMVQLQNESVIFSCLSADCKVVHEFIGGYIFMSMRSKDANQQLDEELFHKLTGGWL